MTDHDLEARGTAMLEACFDRAAAQTAALAIGGDTRSAAAARRSLGWLRIHLRRLVG